MYTEVTLVVLSVSVSCLIMLLFTKCVAALADRDTIPPVPQ